MKLAFGTGALATGVVTAVIAGVVIWVASLVVGWTDPWSVGVWLVAVAGIVAALAAYVAEWIAYRRTLADMRSHGEPWAYRDGGRDRA